MLSRAQAGSEPIEAANLRRLTGSVIGFPAHEARAAALGEVHARPHPSLSVPRIVVQIAFMTEGGSVVDHAVLGEISRRLGIAPPDRQARHHAMRWGRGSLHWERHTEFSTYLWEAPLSDGERAHENWPFGHAFSPPGTAIAGVRLEIRKFEPGCETLLDGFDPASLCHSLIEGGEAEILTDFRQDGDGLTRVLVLDRGLLPSRVGVVAQRLIEIETYRTLAMLGLPLAQALGPRIRRMEDRLVELTAEMRREKRRSSDEILADLTALAAELEADAAASHYRFGASRAYHGIVEERLLALNEVPVPGRDTWTAFLERRVAPAMRTCRSIELRQETLSRKLTRAVTLLRTWVDVHVERQNRDLLASMDRRARLQLRLQQTVEGLSVAAVSYYVVGLIAYLAKGWAHLGPAVQPDVVTAAAAPFAVLAVWFIVRRIRHRHAAEGRHIDEAG